MAKHKPKEFWTAHVAASQASGVSKAAYCRQHRIDYKTLLRWTGCLRRRGTAISSRQALVPVAIRETPPVDRATVMLRIGPDVSLSMPVSIDAVWLGRLLRTVSTC